VAEKKNTDGGKKNWDQQLQKELNRYCDEDNYKGIK